MGGGGKGGGGGGPSAAETGAANRETARYNTEMSFVDQYTPDGSYVYTQISPGDGDKIPPRYRLDTNLSPVGQLKQYGLDNIQLSLLGLGQGQLGRVEEAVSKDFPTFDREAATAQAMKNLTYGYDDRFSREKSALENQLAAQGIRPGSTAYQQAMQDFGDSKNRTYEQAGLQAYQQGLGEMQQMAQYNSWLRSQPLNELSALISGTQVSMPQFTPVQTSQVSQQPYYQPQPGNNWGADLIGLGGSLGSAAIMGSFMSTKQAKYTIGPAETVLDKVKRLPIDRWRYKPDYTPDGAAHIGPYAEDWHAAFGGAKETISVIDALGVALKAVQELAAEVDELKTQLKEKQE